jgi:predicted SAM-dependent methyltransferase
MKINNYAKENNLQTINLHLGCGGENWRDWINIDNYDYDPKDTSRHGSNYDIKMDIRELEVKDSTVDKISLIHTIEHFVRWESVELFKHFFQKLKKGGTLHIEMPDLDKCIEWYLKGESAPQMNTPLGRLNMGFTQFYGNQWSEIDFETHRYVWTKSELRHVLETIGYSVLELHNDKSSHQVGRDLYLIACK